MIIEFQDNLEVLDYLEGFTFSLSMIYSGEDETEGSVDWGLINSLCHRRVYRMEGHPQSPPSLDEKDLQRLHRKYQLWIDRHSKSLAKES